MTAPSLPTVIRATADRLAYDLITRHGLTFGHPAAASVCGRLVADLRQRDAGAADTVAGAILGRLADYRAGAPWHLWPLREHGQRLALLLAGIDEEEEQDAVTERYCADIEAEMIRAGFSAEVASEWVEEIAVGAGVAESDLSLAGGYQMGRG